MTCRRTVFPFTAIVGQERMKKALVLNAINLNLGGVLIRGQKGTAKSTAVRALADLLPEIEVVKDCPFNCNPHQRSQMCNGCFRRKTKGEKLPVIKRKVKVVDLPLGSTEDRIIGTLNIEHAIKKGEKIYEPGILAAAHRGILYVDEVNLLDDHLVDVLLDAAAMGVNYVEREGVSFSHPARFILIGTMNPEEGELRPQLLDRFGLCVEVEGIDDSGLRVEIIRRCMEYENEPHSFVKKWSTEEEKLSRLIMYAKDLFSRVRFSDDILSLIADIAIEMNVDGHRSDIFMLKVAQTIAAYHQRTEITADDVKEAAELVLSHRMRRKPFQEPKVDREKLEESVRKHHKGHQHNQNNPAQQNNNPHKPSGKNQEQGSRRGSQSETTFEPSEPYPVKKISLPADPRVKTGSGRRSKAQSDTKSGRYIKSRIPQDKANDIAFDATFRAAAPYQAQRSNSGVAIAIESQDIREKVRERKIGNIIMFVVDSSGSMGANRRMVETKGAILSLLVDAYQNRDRVGLVAFKADRAELLLLPTSSVELAKKQLEDLPTGGKTPLSKGLLRGFEVLRGELNRDKKISPLFVVISDGKANVSINDGINPFDEAKIIAAEIKKLGINSIVIDTETGFVKLGKLNELSEILGAKYFHLEDIKAEAISNIVKEFLN